MISGLEVYKFGGASLADAARIRHVASILQQSEGFPLVIVSALGKNTNALEKVVAAFFEGRPDEALSLFGDVGAQHRALAIELTNEFQKDCLLHLEDFVTEVSWLLHDKPVRDYDYYYDQIVPAGEMMSSALLHWTLRENGLPSEWVDVRDVLRTDAHFRNASVNWEATQELARQKLSSAGNQFVITQGFIGCTDENESTTLGREGSDFTGAIFANVLNAASLTIWKDVPGVMNGDPRVFSDAVILPALSYEEVIEMAYYGAQVIHPKTLKPLQNRNIPLHVKCFLDPMLPGTMISGAVVSPLPPVRILKYNQALVSLRTRDLSFFHGDAIAAVYKLMDAHSLSPDLIQMGAISMQVCLDERSGKSEQTDQLERFAAEAALTFEVEVRRGLGLLTVRHINADQMDEIVRQYRPVLLQRKETMVSALFVTP